MYTYVLILLYVCISRLQLIDDLSYEDVKKCYRGSVSIFTVYTSVCLVMFEEVLQGTAVVS